MLLCALRLCSSRRKRVVAADRGAPCSMSIVSELKGTGEARSEGRRYLGKSQFRRKCNGGEPLPGRGHAGPRREPFGRAGAPGRPRARRGSAIRSPPCPWPLAKRHPQRRARAGHFIRRPAAARPGPGAGTHTHTAPHSTGDGTSVVFLLFETLSFLSTFGAAEAAAVMAQPPTSEGASAPPTSRALAAVAWSQLWPRLAGQCCCSGVDTSAQDFEYH